MIDLSKLLANDENPFSIKPEAIGYLVSKLYVQYECVHCRYESEVEVAATRPDLITELWIEMYLGHHPGNSFVQPPCSRFDGFRIISWTRTGDTYYPIYWKCHTCQYEATIRVSKVNQDHRAWLVEALESHMSLHGCENPAIQLGYLDGKYLPLSEQRWYKPLPPEIVNRMVLEQKALLKLERETTLERETK